MEFDRAKIDAIRNEIEVLKREIAVVQKKIEEKTAELNIAIRTYNMMAGTKLPPAVATMGVGEKLEMVRRR